MARFCAPYKDKRRGVCTGDLNRRITLNSRTLNAPQTTIFYSHSFTNSIPTWANVETVKGKEIFGGTNMDERISHIFRIRYRPNITAEFWVTFMDVLYDIVEIENPEEDDGFLYLKCNLRGDKDQPVNEA